jgi:hypothetical protein
MDLSADPKLLSDFLLNPPFDIVFEVIGAKMASVIAYVCDGIGGAFAAAYHDATKLAWA